MQCQYGTAWLTGAQYAEDTGPLVVQGRALVQVAALLRADTPYVKGRGNKAVTLPVPVVLQFEDWISALRYCHEAFWDLPDDGTLKFIEQWGTDKLTITYPLAALEGTEIKRVESTVTVIHTFTVTGPPTFVTDTGEPLRILSESGEPIITES